MTKMRNTATSSDKWTSKAMSADPTEGYKTQQQHRIWDIIAAENQRKMMSGSNMAGSWQWNFTYGLVWHKSERCSVARKKREYNIINTNQDNWKGCGPSLSLALETRLKTVVRILNRGYSRSTLGLHQLKLNGMSCYQTDQQSGR